MVKLKREPRKELINISSETERQKTTKDRIFKKIFSIKELFLMFVQDFIKEDWVAQLTIEDLEIMPVRFLNLRDGDRESDILYKVNLKEEEIFVFIHLEHQTKVNFLMSFRVMEYMTRIWRNWINEQDELTGEEKPSERKGFLLPPIYPVIFYDGRNDWTAETEFAKKVKDYQRFEKYIPKFNYSVISLAQISYNKLNEMKDSLSLIMMVDKLKTTEDFKQLSQQKIEKSYFEKIKEKLTDDRIKEVINEAITLLLERINVSEEEIRKIKAYISEGRLEQMFEMLVDYDVQKVKMEGKLEGIKIGEQKGKLEGKFEGKIEVAKNMLAKNFTVDLIVEVTGLSSEEINRIKEEIAGNIQ
jgi:predicted transposase/invertase (TIGR01784 family)